MPSGFQGLEERTLKRPGFLDPKHLRFVGLACVGLAMSGLVVGAKRDVGSRTEQAWQIRSERLRDLGRSTNLLFLAEASRVDSLLQRLRTELRAQGFWNRPGILDALNLEEDDRWEVEGRRLLALLRRGRQEIDDVDPLELVVAGQSGLSMLRVDGVHGLASPPVPDSREREGLAKALWYADEIRRAVESGGRRVERGDPTFERVEDAEIPSLRVAIGLNEPGELVQGAIVATVRLDGLARRLAALAGAGLEAEIVTPDGRRLGSPSAEAAVEPRLASLAARVLGTGEAPGIFEADGRLVLGIPLAHADGRPAHLLALLETAAPPQGFPAWRSTAWPGVLCLAALISAVAVWALLRRRREDLLPGPAIKTGTREACPVGTAEVTSSDGIRFEPFVLREWLSDVRSCLERDAAIRGLALDLRCERSLPDTLESDPAWLGGLLVAMGREALDATADERLCFEVLEDVGQTVRFELTVAGGPVEPVDSMEIVASRLGGRFESGGEGHMALILEGAFARNT